MLKKKKKKEERVRLLITLLGVFKVKLLLDTNGMLMVTLSSC